MLSTAAEIEALGPGCSFQRRFWLSAGVAVLQRIWRPPRLCCISVPNARPAWRPAWRPENTLSLCSVVFVGVCRGVEVGCVAQVLRSAGCNRGQGRQAEDTPQTNALLVHNLLPSCSEALAQEALLNRSPFQLKRTLICQQSVGPLPHQ